MPHQNTSGSTLGALASKADQLRKIRTRLGFGQEAATRPQANLQAAAPTNPAASTGPDFDVEGAVQTAASSNRDRLLELIRRNLPALGQQDIGGGLAGPPTPETEGQPVQDMTQVLRPEAQPLAKRLAGIGAQAASPMEQFARIAGRIPSPRELAVFQARSILEQQFGRPPTPTELKLYLLRPEEEDTSFPRAFEA